MNLRLRTHRPHRQPWLLGLLLCACLLAQTLGLVHRVQHGGAGAPAQVSATGAAPHADGHLHLFTGHVDRSDCQLFDHLGAAELLAGVPMLAVATLRVPPARAGAQAGVVVRRTLAFRARAPPALR